MREGFSFAIHRVEGLDTPYRRSALTESCGIPRLPAGWIPFRYTLLAQFERAGAVASQSFASHSYFHQNRRTSVPDEIRTRAEPHHTSSHAQSVGCRDRPR